MKRKNNIFLFFCSGDLIIAVGPFLSPSLLFPGYASERSAAARGPLPPSLSSSLPPSLSLSLSLSPSPSLSLRLTAASSTFFKPFFNC